MGALGEAHLAAAACDDDFDLEDDVEAPSDAMEAAVRTLLVGLGEDEQREGLRKTPKRVAMAFREGTQGYKQKVRDIVQGALFPEVGVDKRTGSAGGTGGQVVVRDIDLFSYCESCLLPFSIQCHVGYVPSGGRVVGLSKLSRVADVFAKRLQNPQRLANEVCGALHASIKPAGVAVALQCWHIPFPENLKCKTLQGWIRTSHSSRSGVFEDETSSFWNDFLTLLKLRGINMGMDNVNYAASQSWCPLRPLEVPVCNGHYKKNATNGAISTKVVPTPSNMVSAVSSMLQSLGEDPLRKELLGTPQRYVQWLMKFRSSNLDVKLNGFTLNNVSFTLNNVSAYQRAGGDARDHGEICSELHLPFCSQCEHHLLPFHGVVHIGYFDHDNGGGIDRGHFQSLVHFYGCKLQVQERMTRQIAEAVYSVSHGGVIVVVEANHICMISRGIEKIRSNTATIAVLGQFLTDPSAKAFFLQNVLDTTDLGV